jgi:glutathione S-transferase
LRGSSHEKVNRRNVPMPDELPILYTFRRCPYAIRARLAIYISGYQCELREVILRDKPEAMIEASPKATVPVLVLADDNIIDQSLDIMLHVLSTNDPMGWLGIKPDTQLDMLRLIDETENDFKPHLDLYKYASRSTNPDPELHRTRACKFLDKLELLLSANKHLFGKKLSLADFAILPFVRQFAQTDRAWFDVQHRPLLHPWLREFENSDIRSNVMEKYPAWTTGDEKTYFPGTSI